MATKDEKDKAYADGVKDGKNDSSLGDFVQGLGLGSSSMDKDLRDTYDKGHDFGRDHRYDGNQREGGSKTSKEASSSDSSTRDRGDSDRSYNSTDYSHPIPAQRKWHHNWFFTALFSVIGFLIGVGLLILIIAIITKYHIATLVVLWILRIVLGTIFFYIFVIAPITAGWQFSFFSIGIVLITLAIILGVNSVISGGTIILLVFCGFMSICICGILCLLFR